VDDQHSFVVDSVFYEPQLITDSIKYVVFFRNKYKDSISGLKPTEKYKNIIKKLETKNSEDIEMFLSLINTNDNVIFSHLYTIFYKTKDSQGLVTEDRQYVIVSKHGKIKNKR
jgi:hypothetical protein